MTLMKRTCYLCHDCDCDTRVYAGPLSCEDVLRSAGSRAYPVMQPEERRERDDGLKHRAYGIFTIIA